jgi:hypothetical protein
MSSWRGRDDRSPHGFVYLSIVQRLAKIVDGIPGFHLEAASLREATFAVCMLPTDGGPNWDEFVAKELEETLTGNCLDVTWLCAASCYDVLSH